MSHFSLIRNFWEFFKQKLKVKFNGKQEKETIICVRIA